LPIYEYRCENGHTFEVKQSMSDGPITICEVCSSPVERVFHPVAVHFKGSGFYTTDYGRNRSGGGSSSDSGKDESGGSSGGESKSDKKETTATKSEGSGGSGGSDSSSGSGSSGSSNG
jgi:putative FmdB family regulatory protein